MANGFKSIRTRFRAYQLGQAGSSFSYFAGDHFTLVEAVITDVNHSTISEELAICNKTKIDTLHITSWDQDHCSPSGLDWILTNLKPKRIEYPGYMPHTDCGETCMSAIQSYEKHCAKTGSSVKAQAIDPAYIAGLNSAAEFEYENIFYHPKQLQENSNNNSTIKFFRSGSFTVLSLGDVEDPNIAAMLRRCKTLCRETDVMILAHHGADNGFTTKRLLEAVKPSIAICSSNYDNKFDHPRQEIRDLLHEQDIRLFTTKTGDVVVESTGTHRTSYQVTNWCAGSTKVSSVNSYKPRKAYWLSMNADTLRNVLNPGFKGLKKPR